MAKAFEAKTRYGSWDTARIAGTESTAKMMSVTSTTNSAASSGVAARRPLIRVKNFCPSSSSVTGMILRSRPRPRVDSFSASSARWRMILATRVDQEHAEHQQQPPEPADQCAAQHDEERPQRKCAEDAPEQHPVLILQRDRQRGEQHRPDEHVVDAERLLDQVAADVLAERGAAVHHRDDDRERQTAHHPDGRLDRCFLGRRRVRLAVSVQVDPQHGDDDHEQRDPRSQGDVDVDELGTIGGCSNEGQRNRPFDCLEITDSRRSCSRWWRAGGRAASCRVDDLTRGLLPLDRSSLAERTRDEDEPLGAAISHRAPCPPEAR